MDLSYLLSTSMRGAFFSRRTRQPLGVVKYNVVDLAKSLVGGGRHRKLYVDELKDIALQRVPYDDFGDLNHKALQSLVDSLNRDASLHAYGRLLMAEDIIEKLCWQLGLEFAFRNYPSLSDVRIEAPIFIVGLPRSGTTLLHALLARDDNFRWMPAWEAKSPLPKMAVEDRNSDPRRKAAIAAEKVLQEKNKEYIKKHFVSYDEPEECLWITKSTFMSGAYWWVTGATGYLEWLGENSFDHCYKIHKKYLQIMQAIYEKPRWLLKCPAHLGNIAAIKNIYPDAKFIHIHRDPMKSLASGASLSYTQRQHFLKRVVPAKVGGEVASVNASVISNYMAQRNEIGDDDFIDVYYKDIVSDPISLVKDVYNQLDIEMNQNTAVRISQYLNDNPQGKFGVHKYSLGQYGLNEGKERLNYADYMAAFNIKQETV